MIKRSSVIAVVWALTMPLLDTLKRFEMERDYLVGVLDDNSGTWDVTANMMTRGEAENIKGFLLSMPRQNFTDSNVKIFLVVD